VIAYRDDQEVVASEPEPIESPAVVEAARPDVVRREAGAAERDMD
jgi:hypothetical protein